jgi:DNA-binding XRE family transcriptional regulator
MDRYLATLNFVVEECCECGMAFAMTRDFRDRRINDRDWFYCPKGHAQHYTGKTEEQKLREQLEKAQLDAAQESIKASSYKQQRDEVARTYCRMRTRVKNGVCPCCNRTFTKLLAHMRTKHPSFGNDKVLRSLREIYGLTQAALAAEVGVASWEISRFERQKPVNTFTREQLEEWIERSA